jgi:hypothetical protein
MLKEFSTYRGINCKKNLTFWEAQLLWKATALKKRLDWLVLMSSDLELLSAFVFSSDIF